MSQAPKIVVSVIVTAYNHGTYIAECLDSILCQNTTFPFEIIIGEDESSDETRQICKAYAAKYPNQITLYLRSRKDTIYIHGNPTGRYNFTESLQAAKGIYIALCEGDDYWIDPLKLQKQVDFLEAHPSYTTCFHEAEVLWETGKNPKKIKYNSDFDWNVMTTDRNDYDILDTLKGPFMATASVMFRSKALGKLPFWFYKVSSGDMALHTLVVKDQKIRFINEVMSAYRRHDSGASRKHRGNIILIDRVRMLDYIDKHYEGNYRDAIREAVANYLSSIHSLNVKEYWNLITLYRNSAVIDKKYIRKFFKKLFVK